MPRRFQVVAFISNEHPGRTLYVIDDVAMGDHDRVETTIGRGRLALAMLTKDDAAEAPGLQLFGLDTLNDLHLRPALL
jgi:hypothetical protein